MKLDKLYYFFANTLGITRLEGTVIAFLILSLFSGIIGILFNGYVSKEKVINQKDKESLLGTTQDSMFAERTFQQWNSKETRLKNNIQPSYNKPQQKKRDINKVTKKELVQVKGIGVWTANQILKVKQKNGGKIRSFEEIKNIPHLRPHIYSTIRKHFEIRGK